MMNMCVGQVHGNYMFIHFLCFVSDTILVVVEQVRTEVQAALEACGLKIRLEIVSIPAAEDWGTADTLRFLGDRIKVCLSL
jgi:hypothetical protein